MTRGRRVPILRFMRTSRPFRVLVAGGGFASAEALLALRKFAEDLVELHLVAPQERLSFRPAATTAAAVGDEVQTFALAQLAEATGSRLHRDKLEAVAPAARRVRLASGAHLDYDALLLGVGARARAAVPGAMTFRDQRDAPHVATVLDEIRTGAVRRLVLAAPPGVTWTLPLYELALYAARAGEARDRCVITIVTPERAPLAVLGRDAAAAVAQLLREHDVRFMGGTRPELADRSGLRLAWGGSVPADRVIAVPALVGPRIAGVPSHDFSGFVHADGCGRVTGLPRVWAAGDMTTCPVKQGGLAAQHAARAAADIAMLAGATPPALHQDPLVLRAKLVGGRAPLYLRVELDPEAQSVASTSVASDEPPWWPDAKVFGRHVTPWMAAAASA